MADDQDPFFAKRPRIEVVCREVFKLHGAVAWHTQIVAISELRKELGRVPNLN